MKRLTGRNTLAYLGDEPTTPPQFEIHNRAPLVTDYHEYDIGCFWLNTAVEPHGVYLLIKKYANQATWILLNAADRGVDEFRTDTNIAYGVNHTINIYGGTNISTIAPTPGGSTVQIDLDDNVTLAGNLVINNPGTVTIGSFAAGAIVADNAGLLGSVNGTAGYVLTSNGAGFAPSFQAPVGGVTNVVGGANINCVNVAGTVTVNLNESIFQPNTNAAGTQGLYALGGNDFLHNYGNHNTFLGQSAGNRTLTVANADNNTGIGFEALASLNDGDYNTAIGDGAGDAITDGGDNTCCGSEALGDLQTGDCNSAFGDRSLTQLVTGDYNLGLGFDSGSNYTGAESSNIMIGNLGVLGESNKIRIGTNGAGAAQQDTTYIAGIYGTAPSAINRLMFIGNDHKLGSSIGTNGQLLIGATGASPAWANLVSGDGSVTFTLGANSIDVRAPGGGGGGGATTFITDINSPAIIIGNNITMAGEGVIQTDGVVANTVTYRIIDGANGQLIIGGGGAGAAWGNLASAGGTVNITYPGVNQINLEVAAGVAAAFQTDNGIAYPLAGTLNLVGGSNINTDAVVANTVTVNLDESIALPNTNAAGTQGLYSLGGNSFLHNYGTNNVFLGAHAGNRTLTVGNATNTAALGTYSLNALTTGASNSMVGSYAGVVITSGSNNSGLGFHVLDHLTTGSANSAFGFQALNGILAGSNNIALGNQAGSNFVAGDSSNIVIGHLGVAGQSNTIRIGTQGAGAGQQNTTYMAGIYGSVAGVGAVPVAVNGNGQLTTYGVGVNGQILIGGGTGPIWNFLTSAGGTINITYPGANQINLEAVGGGGGLVNQVHAGSNINITGTVQDPTVNLNDAIYWPGSTDQNHGSISLGANRFMSAAGGTFLGVNAGNYNYRTWTGLHYCYRYQNVGIGQQALYSLQAPGELPHGGCASAASYNTAVGGEALYSNVAGLRNTAVGYQALRAYGGDGATAVGSGALLNSGGLYNTALGYSTLINLTTGVNNLGLGTYLYIGSGSSYTTESNNICINNSGTPGDNGVIRIGNSVQHLNSTYVYGVYGAAIGATAVPVYVDNNGQLGTSYTATMLPAFQAYQYGNVPNATGDGTVYWLGTSYALTEVYDIGNNFNPGNGAGGRATFTAPVTGLYFLFCNILLTNLPVPPLPAPPCNDPLNIVTTNRTYAVINPVLQTSGATTQSVTLAVSADMNAGDTAQYNFSVVMPGMGRTIGIGSYYTKVGGFYVR